MPCAPKHLSAELCRYTRGRRRTLTHVTARWLVCWEPPAAVGAWWLPVSFSSSMWLGTHLGLAPLPLTAPSTASVAPLGRVPS